MESKILGLKATKERKKKEKKKKDFVLLAINIPDPISLYTDLNHEEIASEYSQSETLGEHCLFGFVKWD